MFGTFGRMMRSFYSRQLSCGIENHESPCQGAINRFIAVSFTFWESERYYPFQDEAQVIKSSANLYFQSSVVSTRYLKWDRITASAMKDRGQYTSVHSGILKESTRYLSYENNCLERAALTKTNPKRQFTKGQASPKEDHSRYMTPFHQ